MTALLALASALLIGTADYVGALLSRTLPAARVAAVNQLLGLLLAIPVAVAWGAERVTALDVLWSVLSGVCVGIGLLWFYAAMARGLVSLVAPLAAVIGAVAPAVVGLARGERPGAVPLTGIAIALVAIAVVSFGGSGGDARTSAPVGVLARAVGAGLLFGAFYTFISLPSEQAGLWSMPLSRLGAGAALVLVAFRLTGGLAVGRASLRTIAALATLEVTATVALVLSLQRGPVSIAAVLASLYPVTTVLLAAVYLGERLARRQITGVALALVAVVLVSVG